MRLRGRIQESLARALVDTEWITGPAVAEVRRNLEQLYANGSRVWPLWESMEEAEGIQDPLGWKVMEGFLSADPCLMLFNPGEEEAMLLFRHGTDVLPFLEDFSVFEFYVTNEVCSYLFCFNHHDVFLADGEAASWLAQKRKELGSD